jgi:hypothetical protein
MKPIPYDVRQEYWKYQLAKQCFLTAESLCDRMIKESISREDDLFPPLMLSMIVLYARPFKQRLPFRFPATLVPENLRVCHEYLVMLRDKSIAHADADSPELEGNVLNKIVMTVLEDGRIQSGMEGPTPSPPQLEEIRHLLHIMREKAQYYVSKIWKKHMAKEPIPPGRYEVNLQKGKCGVGVTHLKDTCQEKKVSRE